QAAEAFPEVPLPKPPPHPKRWPDVSILAGAGLIGVSFALERRADRAYDRYLEATDPSAITRLYDRARSDDNLSTLSLLGGEALVAFGVYLKFLRRAPGDRLALQCHADRCAVCLRF